MTLVPAACVVVGTGWTVIVGATTAPPELELLEEDELLDEDELELEEEEDELEELLDELLLACVLTDMVGLFAE